ncbi:MAG: hypothetical protein EZS28_028609, partial [Streblomastix strix]
IEADALLDDKLNISDQIDAYDKTEADALLDNKLNISDQIDAQSKTKDDELLAFKLNITNQIDTYNKTQVKALLDNKLNISDQIDAYNKIEVDALLDDKLNITDQIDAYSKQEDDALLLIKVKNNLEQLVFLTYRNGVKMMHLFFLPEDVICKSKGFVFATTDEMNTWTEDQEIFAKLTIGDNQYIFDKQVMDYWLDVICLRVLETELPDISNVITILGTATEGGN